MQKPEGYENDLSTYGPQLFDSSCGEPIGWGFAIVRYLGDDKFEALRQHGALVCIDMGKWVLITKWLTREEAKEKYGEITNEEFGPRGGWKSVTFGQTKFISTYMKEWK